MHKEFIVIKNPVANLLSKEVKAFPCDISLVDFLDFCQNVFLFLFIIRLLFFCSFKGVVTWLRTDILLGGLLT